MYIINKWFYKLYMLQYTHITTARVFDAMSCKCKLTSVLL